jgi:hypothetical protein
MKYPDQENFTESLSCNIDLEFWAVSYINLPSTILGVNIREIVAEQLPKEINRELLIYDMKIFELESAKSKYFVIAGGHLIVENKSINQDRIANYNLNLEHEKIIFNSN